MESWGRPNQERAAPWSCGRSCKVKARYGDLSCGGCGVNHFSALPMIHCQRHMVTSPCLAFLGYCMRELSTAGGCLSLTTSNNISIATGLPFRNGRAGSCIMRVETWCDMEMEIVNKILGWARKLGTSVAISLKNPERQRKHTMGN
jgi:hypothetical protein